MSLVALVASLSACGADEPPPPPEPRHPVTDVVHRLQERFAARNVEGVCELMARQAQTQAGKVAHAEPTTCVRDVRKVFKMIDGGGGWLDGDPPRVTTVRESGRVATAVLASGEWSGRMPFVEERGRWKLAGFFGEDPGRFKRLEAAFPRESFPRTTRPVTVQSAGGDGCGQTSAARYPAITGGCVVRVSEGSSPVEMLTPFGGFKFGDCSVDYRVIVDGQGRTWTDEWEVEGPPETGCSDINPCVRVRGQLADRLPWKGRISGDGEGGFVHRMDMCLRTCIGLFAGEFVMQLDSDDAPSGWRVEQSSSGDTGFRFGDALAVEGDPLTIVARRPAG